MAENEAGRALVAFVALNSPRVPTPAEVLARLRDRYALDPLPELMEPEGGSDSAFFGVPDGMAFYSPMPAPIPWGDLEGPCQTARWWPEAAAELRGHTHHFIVSLMGGSGTPLERHVWLTKFVAAVAEAADAVGVYWGGGTVVHKAHAFCELAAVTSADDYLPQLWIDTRLWGDEAGRVSFATTGMAAFDLPEIEVERTTLDPRELLEFCANIIRYVVDRGDAIPDGDTLGRTATERITVRHRPSMWERAGPVMQLVMR